MKRINLRQQSTEKKVFGFNKHYKTKIQRKDSLNCTYKLPLAIVWHV